MEREMESLSSLPLAGWLAEMQIDIERRRRGVASSKAQLERREVASRRPCSASQAVLEWVHLSHDVFRINSGLIRRLSCSQP